MVVSKYAPLGDYLRKQRRDLVPMTFSEIERIVGTKLPRSQCYPAWWSNNPWNNVMTQVWLDAGFQTEQVDVEGRKLVFRRVGASKVKDGDDAETFGRSNRSEEHPLIGCMKGTVRIAPGVDLTEPADPEWGERAWGDHK
jgi:hypothetical protein